MKKILITISIIALILFSGCSESKIIYDEPLIYTEITDEISNDSNLIYHIDFDECELEEYNAFYNRSLNASEIRCLYEYTDN